MPTAPCGRCKRWVPAKDAEWCRVCNGPLCVYCWDEWGQCGHPGEDAKVLKARELVARRFP